MSEFHTTPLEESLAVSSHENNPPSFKDKCIKLVHSNRFANAFLVVSIILLVLSFSLTITRQQNTSDTQASEFTGNDLESTVELPDLPVPTPYFSEFPTRYKDASIPRNFFVDGYFNFEDVEYPLTQKIVNDTIAKYYVYRDLLETNSIITVENEPTTYEELEILTSDYEELVFDNFVSQADFYYMLVSVTFNTQEYEDKIEEQLGMSLDKAGLEKAEEYKLLFEENIDDIESVFEVARNDERLLIITGKDLTEDGIFKEDFVKTDKLFGLVEPFSNFLFNLEVNQVSDIFTVNSERNKIGYLIVIPTKIQDNEYDTLNQLIENNIQFFIYE